MTKFQLSYKPFGDKAILIEWPARIDPLILDDILNFKHALKLELVNKDVRFVHAYHSLTVFYSSTVDFDYEVNVLEAIRDASSLIERHTKKLTVPVCYQGNYASDIQDYCQVKSLAEREVISLHTQSEYLVCFIGFLPGFLYLGGLDKRLHLPRKATPSKSLAQGSVAIGGEQTGIYPQQSPGGWHVIGRTPLKLFDVNEDKPCPVEAGDKLVFKSVSVEDYLQLEKEISLGASATSLDLIEKLS